MDDQASQNARLETEELLRRHRWQELTAQQQAASLVALAQYIASHQDLANTVAARNGALLAASHLHAGALPPSPIAWSSLNDEDLEVRLREIAGDRDLDGRDRAFQDYCSDLADQTERRRRDRTREGRER